MCTVLEILCLHEILGRWYTRESNLLRQSSSPKAVYFCRMDTGESLEKCSNPSCQISFFHPLCLKISQVPKVWYCPNCQKLPEFKMKKSKNTGQNEVVLRAQEKGSICVCMRKPQNGDKLIECHSDSCSNGKFFHMSCLNYKRIQKQPGSAMAAN